MARTAAENRELLKLLELKDKREALKDYSKFSSKYIKITNKSGEKVPLNQNYVQRQIENKIKELQSQGIPPRLIVLKSRQMGVSTDTQGRMTKETTTKGNKNGFIVSHEEGSTKAIFQKAKYMFDNLPDDIKPLQKASNATELIFDEPNHYKGKEEGLHSKIEIKTAGNAGIGRSETRHYAHLSEYAFWKGKDENSPDKQLSSIMQAIPDDVDTWVIIESTANGYNDFKNQWDMAVRGDTEFIPMFFPWYVHEEYVRELDVPEHEFIDNMCEYQKFLYSDLALPLERINWWKHTKASKCNNDLNQMKQENPTTPEEAFIFSGTPVFDNEKVQKRIEYLRSNQTIKTGYFSFKWHDSKYQDYILDDTIEFVESSTKPWIRIFKDKDTMVPYVIGGDTKGEGSDYYAATVIDNSNGVRCASIHWQISNSKPYTHQMYCLGRYYNDALIGIEMNFNTAPIEELQRLDYPNQYIRRSYDSYKKTTQKKYGWKTDGNTRPILIDKEIDLIEHNIELFNDIDMLQECLTFVYDKNNRPDAMDGKHDDLLISDMICNEIRAQQTTKIEPDQYDINWDKVPSDLREDYENGSDNIKEMLLARWREKGLFK